MRPYNFYFMSLALFLSFDSFFGKSLWPGAAVYNGPSPENYSRGHAVDPATGWRPVQATAITRGNIANYIMNIYFSLYNRPALHKWVINIFLSNLQLCKLH